MNKATKLKKKKHRRKYIIVFFIIFILLFIKTSYKYSQKTASNIAEAGNVSESILLMSEKATINMALQQEKEIIKAKKIEKAQLEKERMDKLEAAKTVGKIAYLTFDDGPSDNITPKVLDILNEYNIKATFFVVGSLSERYPDLIERIHGEGHAIGNHSYSHRYNHIYRNTTNFINELKTTEKVLKNILGEEYETKIIRFPGGSFGDKKAVFRKAVVENGYTYYDWNSLNGDAEGLDVPKNKLVQRFKSTSNGKKELTILMHDMNSKSTTVEALPEIIEYLLQNDYVFDTLK